MKINMDVQLTPRTHTHAHTSRVTMVPGRDATIQHGRDNYGPLCRESRGILKTNLKVLSSHEIDLQE